MENKYSVLMPLYKKDNPEFFSVAINSIIEQTIKPDEIVLVCDGVIPECLLKVVNKTISENPNLIKIYKFEVNRGLGMTLADGIKLCKNEIIVRMDADDFSVKNRCERQLKVLMEHPEYDVVGSNVLEFIDSFDNIVSTVILPENPEECYSFAKRRCPIRHPSLMYKKSKVLAAGNYRDYRHAQDYNLMVHMLQNKSKIYNIQDYLVYMRVSEDFYKRRGGFNQMKIVLRLKKEFYDIGFYSLKDFMISGLGNALVCLLPNSIREVFYKNILRK